MTTKELKSYIDRILGNNVRCLLPSYWWKRLFSLTLDKVDEKLDAANIKTINGESVIGEGNLKVGITTVSSMEELNALEAKIGYVATVASEYSTVNVEDCYLPNGENIVAEWDKLTPIRKVEVLGYDGSNFCQILLSAKVNDFRDCIAAVYDANNNNYVYSKGSVVDQTSTELSKSEFDALLLERDYRYVGRIIQGELTVDSVFTLYTDSSTADAYIKGDTWTRLLKEGEGGNITVDSELSDVSENPLQNKVVTEALNGKVDKVDGKQLSTEDFTTALKTKLEGLSEVDTSNLATKADLNAKQDVISDLATIRSGAAKGASIEVDEELIKESHNPVAGGAVVAALDQIMEGITSSFELVSEQIEQRQYKIEDLDEIRAGAAKGATAIQSVKSINGQSIVGSGNVVISADTSNLATKDELANLTNEIEKNEEVVASALNDFNDRLNNAGGGSGVVTFYAAENFTDEIKAKNKAAYETYITAVGTKGVVFNLVDSGINLFPVASYMEGDVLLLEIITTLFSESNTIESLILPCHPDGTVEA